MKKVLSVMILMAVLVSFATAEKPEAEKKLTLQDAILIALKNNLDLQIQKSNTRLSLQNLKISQAIWIPQMSTTGEYETSLRPSENIYDGVNTVETTGQLLNTNISERIPYGGMFTLFLGNSSSDTNSLSARLDPSITAYAGLQLTQPLLKNFGKLATKYNIFLSARDYKISKLQLQQQILDLVYNVESAYWELVYAYQDLGTRKMALKLAQDLLKQNEVKVKVGTAAPIEILSSKAQVAQNESAVIQAEQTIQTREENLKRILNMSKNAVTISPLDRPEVKDLELNFNDFLLEALQNRLDMRQAKLELEKQNITVKYFKNQALPDLSLTASFYTYGTGGTAWQVPPGVSPFDPEFKRIKILELDLWDAWDEVVKMNNKNYTIRLNLNIPLGFKKEKAELARARINLERSVMQLKNTENTVYSEVKQVIKKLESQKKLVESTKIAEELQYETLKAEEKKLSVGISTNFEVLNYQRDYSNAQVSALRSVINYVLAVAEINKTLNRTFKVYNINFSDFYSNK